MTFSPFDYFTDPVLQAPMMGSILMCLASALIGVIVFLKKRSLLGEALSHATYPGVVLSVLFMAVFFPEAHEFLSIAILIGAFASSLLGLWVIEFLELKLKVKNDAALCFVLSVFFGVGVLVASRIQFSHALWYKTVQAFLYGQAATMTLFHVLLYAFLTVLVVILLILLQRQISMSIFDRGFAKSVGIKIQSLDALLFFLLVLAIVIGIRSVGVVLMAGMLIAPAVAARQFSHRLPLIFFLAGVIGAFSGFLGNYLSIVVPSLIEQVGRKEKFSLPTGPMILLSASVIALFSLLFAPENGLLSRFLRIARFRKQCMGENVLKFLWKQGEGSVLDLEFLHRNQSYSRWSLRCLLRRLKKEGWLSKGDRNKICLTRDGWLRAARIVRVHRLWEAYLVSLGHGIEKVHRSAEEMEHILTPELEKQLAEILGHPGQDPHAQPIPPKERTL